MGINREFFLNERNYACVNYRIFFVLGPFAFFYLQKINISKVKEAGRKKEGKKSGGPECSAHWAMVDPSGAGLLSFHRRERVVFAALRPARMYQLSAWNGQARREPWQARPAGPLGLQCHATELGLGIDNCASYKLGVVLMSYRCVSVHRIAWIVSPHHTPCLYAHDSELNGFRFLFNVPLILSIEKWPVRGRKPDPE